MCLKLRVCSLYDFECLKQAPIYTNISIVANCQVFMFIFKVVNNIAFKEKYIVDHYSIHQELITVNLLS